MQTYTAAQLRQHECSAKYQRRNAALDECGIGHDVQERHRAAAEVLADTAAQFLKFAMGQLAHDLLTNEPLGIDYGDGPEEQAAHATRRGLVATIGKLVGWDIYEARKFAAEILEDVNDHDEAAILFAKAEGEEPTPEE